MFIDLFFILVELFIIWLRCIFYTNLLAVTGPQLQSSAHFDFATFCLAQLDAFGSDNTKVSVYMKTCTAILHRYSVFFIFRTPQKLQPELIRLASLAIENVAKALQLCHSSALDLIPKMIDLACQDDELVIVFLVHISSLSWNK